jgi:hypothetical protein
MVKYFVFIFLVFAISCNSDSTKKENIRKNEANSAIKRLIKIDGKNAFYAEITLEGQVSSNNKDSFTFINVMIQPKKDSIVINKRIPVTDSTSVGPALYLAFKQAPHIKSKNPIYILENNQFVIKAETVGTKLDSLNFTSFFNRELSDFPSSINFETENLYEKPLYNTKSKEVIETNKKLNSFLTNPVQLDLPQNEIKINKTDIANWVEVDEKLNIKFNTYKVQSFILNRVKDLQNPNSTISSSIEGEVKNENREVLDIELMANNLIDAIKKSKEKNAIIKPIYSTIPSLEGNQKKLNDFIEINIESQKLYLIKNGQLVCRSNVVTGNKRLKQDTPKGEFKICNKKQNRRLIGKDYNVFVFYWMSIGGNYGIHDAMWRSKFGSKIYETAGSHGCINLPKFQATKVFENAYVGMPVIIN